MKAFQASILFSLVAALCACQSNQYTIAGVADGVSDGDTLFLTNDLETGAPCDTIVVKDGKFTLSGEADSTALCMI